MRHLCGFVDTLEQDGEGHNSLGRGGQKINIFYQFRWYMKQKAG